MKDPYEVLGVTRSATPEQIKAAYRELAKKYHPDNYVNTPLADSANRRMQEINEAYDAINSGNVGNSGNGYGSSYRSYSNNDYSQVISLIQSNRLDEAESILESMSSSSRDARWYYLKGQINYNRGWTDQAFTYFTTAHNMEPNNIEYRYAYENMNNQRNGGFRTSRSTRSENGSRDCTDVCCGLLCADSLCECMGGDLIPCC